MGVKFAKRCKLSGLLKNTKLLEGGLRVFTESVISSKRFNEGREGNLQNHKMTFCGALAKSREGYFIQWLTFILKRLLCFCKFDRFMDF